MGRLTSALEAIIWSRERPIDLVVAMMAALSAMLLGASYHAPLAVWLSLLLIASSVYLNDLTGWLRLERRWASWLSLVAVVAWCIKARLLSGDWQLAAMSYVLLILQVILLFQPKTDRNIAQAMLLSVGLVAVAAGLSPGLWFGPLLVVYMLVGMTALALLGVDHRLVAVRSAGLARPEGALLATGTAVAASGATHAPAGDRPALRSMRFVANPVAWSRPTWRRIFGRQIAGTTALALALTTITFILFPRFVRPLEEIDDLEEGLRSVGFAHDVTLGDEVGAALQNPDVVMRLKFFEEPGHVPLELLGEPLLRGRVLTQYDQGHWKQLRSQRNRMLRPLLDDHFVREQVAIEPFDKATLFAVFPIGRINDDARLQFDELGGELTRPEWRQGRNFDYEVGTLAIQNRTQLTLVPADDSASEDVEALLQMPTPAAGGLDPLAGLRALATSVREEAGIAPEKHLEIAKALNRYLRESARFEYSDSGQKRPSGIDPFEDFVTNNRRGHCEYFAGALALMLRSQGIPARFVIGFKASEYNSAGGYYQVRQLHAHAWVEALLAPDEITGEDLPQPYGFDWSEGAWLTLDPTAFSASDLEDVANHGLWRRARMYVDYLQVLWGRFVSGLNATMQNDLIYAPVAAFFRGAWKQMAALLGRLGMPGFQSDEGGEAGVGEAGVAVEGGEAAIAFTWWRLVLVLLSLAASLLAIVEGIRLGNRWIGHFGRLAARGRSPLAPRASSSEIYARLESVLARHGYLRSDGQTPYEFALAAGGDLAERPGCNPLAALPRRIVEAFYRVRFGRHPLDSSEAQAVEQALSALERGLAQMPAGG